MRERLREFRKLRDLYGREAAEFLDPVGMYLDMAVRAAPYIAALMAISVAVGSVNR